VLPTRYGEVPVDPSFRIHDQRHTAISLWIKAGINPKDVSVHAGHTSVAFPLDRYGHLYPDNGDEFLRAVDSSTDSRQPTADRSDFRGTTRGTKVHPSSTSTP
jgi:hypothetical protein